MLVNIWFSKQWYFSALYLYPNHGDFADSCTPLDPVNHFPHDLAPNNNIEHEVNWLESEPLVDVVCKA